MIVTLVGSSSTATTEGIYRTTQSHRKDRQSLSFHHRADPSSGEKRLYVIMEDTAAAAVASTTNTSSNNHHSPKQSTPCRLCEVQVLAPRSQNDNPETFASFLVQSASATHIVGNGNLYTITEVDPLFFLLPSDLPGDNNTEEKKSSEDDKHTPQKSKHFQWQPLDQILEPLDGTLRKCLSLPQIPHFFASMSLGNDDECFYKFSMDKALAWLGRKQAAVERCLLQQAEAKQARRNNHKGTMGKSASSTDEGAFAAGFHMPSEAPAAATETTAEATATTTKEEATKTTIHAEQRAKKAREESIQIVCSYLNPAWRSRFLAHLQTSPDVLQSAKQRAAKRIHAQVAASEASTTATASTSNTTATASTEWVQKQAEPPAKKPKPSQTVGVARLKKVNTKGMKKMSAFFTVKKKAK